MTRLLTVASLGLALLNAGSSRADIPAQAAPPVSGCEKPWVFFDLGNTLVDTTDWSHLKYLPQAQKYLHQLKSKGYPLGLIVNIPEEWGGTKHQKIEALRRFIDKSWTDRTPFEWALFDRILVPPSNRQRKPAPFLFQKALELASPCAAIYESEEEREVQAAGAAGLKKFIVGKMPGTFYLPVEQIPQVAVSAN